MAIFTSALKLAYAAAVQEGKTHYLTPVARGKDIVISNTFVKANETWIGLDIACPVLKPEGGAIILISNMPEGQVIHYLWGPFGRTTFGPTRQNPEMPSCVRHLIIYGSIQI